MGWHAIKINQSESKTGLKYFKILLSTKSLALEINPLADKFNLSLHLKQNEEGEK